MKTISIKSTDTIKFSFFNLVQAIMAHFISAVGNKKYNKGLD